MTAYLPGNAVCGFCGRVTRAPGEMISLGGETSACVDDAACSDRMQAQGFGRRDWTEREREGMRVSLLALLRRALQGEEAQAGAPWPEGRCAELTRFSERR